MDEEVRYLRQRASVHRRMARHAIGDRARCAHRELVTAYERRIAERLTALEAASTIPSPGAVQDAALAEDACKR